MHIGFSFPTLFAVFLTILAPPGPARGQTSEPSIVLPAQVFATPSRLKGVKSWGYQLQGARPSDVARSPYDVVVVDYSHAGRGAEPYSSREIAKMKRKPDGSRRFVLAYISVGEAEDYRFYWRRSWVETLKLVPKVDDRAPYNPPPPSSASSGKIGIPRAAPVAPPPPRSIRIPKLTAPTWLGRENDAWSGNFSIRYWDQSWQKLVFGSSGSYLERIIDAGFDGIYIDRVDAYYALVGARPSAEREMADFIVGLARHARKLKRDFIVVPQNAEELLLRRDYLTQIDAIAKEDLFYGSYGDGVINSGLQTRNSLGWLGEARKRDLPVFVIEYLKNPVAIAIARKKIEREEFVPYFGPRSLDRLALPREWQPPPPVKAPVHKKTKKN